MFLPTPTCAASSSPFKFFVVLFILIHGAGIAAQDDDDNRVVNIGAIIDVSSRIGKEEEIAMEVAVQELNSSSSNKKYKLVLNISDSGGDPLRAYKAANDLIKERGVQTIIGMETWHETVFVAEIANKAQVPVLSLAAPSITPPLISVRWPFLLRMAYNDSLQIKCLASMVASYRWSRVIVIYEDDAYSTDSGVLTLLSDALGSIGSEIEHWLTFPPFYTLSDPDTIIREELKKIEENKLSRVFIIFQSSLQLVTHLCPQAKQLGLMGRDSVWITTDSVTSIFHTFNSSVLQSMQGVVGIKTHFSATSPVFKYFITKFRNIFRKTYPEEDNSEPGINALRAYDAVSTITKALENSTYNGTSTTLFQSFLATSFSGSSGEIRFNNGELSSPLVYQIVNVFGKSYVKLKFWSSCLGFSDDEEMGRKGDGDGDKRVLGGKVHWPGGVTERVPKGWVMPTKAKPFKIAVPKNAVFKKFVRVKEGYPEGFSIDVFEKAVKNLDYVLPFEYHPEDGSYEDLVDMVYYKNFSAVVGDVTILANRSNYVDFSQPYAESGLSMIVPVKSVQRSQRAWLFIKPFTKAMWLVMGCIFLHTMFVIWFLERRSNPDFSLGIALWFTFSTLFFAHRERLNNNYSRAVIVVWLFIVFVVTNSYTSSLTSMLTVQRLEPTVKDIEALKRNNSRIGCDDDSFVKNYLVQVLGFHTNNIIPISNEDEYPGAFENGTIMAAFLELPYLKDFLSRHCNEYKVTGPAYRFGGFGFVFQKGSPMARDISEAILKISEDGNLTNLENTWFPESLICSENTEDESLSLYNFWFLFVVTVTISTTMFLLYIVQRFMKSQHHLASPIQVQPLNNAIENWISPNGEHMGGYITPGKQQVAQIEMSEAYVGHLKTPSRISNLASFPGLDRRRLHPFNMDDSECKQFPSST